MPSPSSSRPLHSSGCSRRSPASKGVGGATVLRLPQAPSSHTSAIAWGRALRIATGYRIAPRAALSARARSSRPAAFSTRLRAPKPDLDWCKLGIRSRARVRSPREARAEVSAANDYELAYPSALREKERELLTARRGEPCAPEAARGVALSGGGIRSATFALGVCQALA